MVNRCNKDPSFSFLLGIGLDNEDGHVRVTKGEDFQVIGGSENTHHRMQDKMMEISDDLAKKGKRIKDIGPDDFERVSDIFRS